MAADDYAEGPIQRVSVVAMVVSVPFCIWGLFNTMMYHLDLGMVSYALAGAAGAYGFGLLSVDGYEHSATNVRTVTFAGFGSVAANYLLGLALVPTFSGLGLSSWWRRRSGSRCSARGDVRRARPVVDGRRSSSSCSLA